MYTYDSNRGFTIFWDFVAGLPFHMAEKNCQLMCAQFDGAYPTSDVKSFAPSKCLGDHQTYLIRANFDASTDYHRLAAKTANRIIIELQVVSADNTQSKVVSGIGILL